MNSMERRVVAWIVYRHPPSVSQLPLHVVLGCGPFIFAGGPILTDPVLNLGQLIVEVQRGLHHSFLADLSSRALSFVCLLDSAFECGTRLPELACTGTQVGHDFFGGNLVVDQAELRDRAGARRYTAR